MLKHTPLIELHRAHGAKLVDFAGWEMPLHYGSQLDEHHKVRREAGMFDVSHMLAIDVAGAHAQALLRYTLANDIAKLQEAGAALYSCMLNKHGGILDDLIVYHLHPRSYRLVVNAGTADKDLAWLHTQRQALRARDPSFDVTLTARRDLAIIAVQGPGAREAARTALPSEFAAARTASGTLAPFHAYGDAGLLIARTGYTGEDGFEIMLPASRAPALWQNLHAQGVAPCGLGARDTLRLEAGMNLYGQDMDENVNPLECGLTWTLALKDAREFVGKQALLAAKPAQKRAGLLLLDKGVLRAHQAIVEGGEITSGGFSPTMNRSIALARVPRAIATGEQVHVTIRDQRLRAQVVDPPFVRNGKILIKETA